MFRLFLRKKILAQTDCGSRQDEENPAVKPQSSASFRRNRRIFERYNMDHKHLTLMNDADIFLVREISARGFSTEVAPRSFERLVIGDIYDARLRYLAEIYDLQARVAWKSLPCIGFETIETREDTLNFLKRLLYPIEIAGSLQQVDAAFMSEQTAGKSWYHGEGESDLYVWHDTETNELRAWQLAIGEQYVEWSDTNGLVTGRLAAVSSVPILQNKISGLIHQPDPAVDSAKQQFAVDVIMALQHPVRDELLQTFGLTA